MHSATRVTVRVTVGLLLNAPILFAGQARAEIMQTSPSSAPGHLLLGAEVQVGFLPNSTASMLNIHESVGLAGGLDLYARQGVSLSDRPLYLGAGVKWTILRDGRGKPGLALLGGGHLYTEGGGGGVDGTLLIDHRFGRATPFAGLDINTEFGRDRVDWKVGLVGGAKIGIVTNVNWFIEGGLGLAGHHKPHFVSTGLQVVI